MFRRRFWVNLVLSVPVFVYSDTIQDWFGYTPSSFPGSGWVAPVLATVIYLYGGWVFLDEARSELSDRQPGMMLLIAMAITVAFGASVATELGALDIDFWRELAGLIVVMLLGHWQEMRALGQARGALAALAELLPDEAERLADGDETEKVRVSELSEGDVVLVRPGARVPADGRSCPVGPTWTSR